MTTVREARIQAVSEAIDRTTMQWGDGLSTSHLRITAEAVVDALFPPDSYTDNAELPVADDSVFRSGGQTKQYGPRPRIATARPRADR